MVDYGIEDGILDFVPGETATFSGAKAKAEVRGAGTLRFSGDFGMTLEAESSQQQASP